MAPLPSDNKSPPPDEHGDIGLGFEQEQPHTTVVESSAKMSQARDHIDDLSATAEEDLTRARRQVSKAKKTPTLEASDDTASITDVEHMPARTSISPVDTQLVEKVTGGATSEAELSRNEAPVSSANHIDRLDTSAGTRSSLEATFHGVKSISSGCDSPVHDRAHDISSANRGRANGDAMVSSADRSNKAVGSDGTISPRSRKRKATGLSSEEQLEGARHEQRTDKKTRFAEGAMIESETGPSGAPVSFELPKLEREASRSSGSGTIGHLANTPEKSRGRGKTESRAQPQQALPAHELSVDDRIRALEADVGASGQTVPCRESVPLNNNAKLQLQECVTDLDLTVLDPILQHFQSGKDRKANLLSQEMLLLLFASNDCAPALKQWKEECFDDPYMQDHLPFALQETASPWSKEAEQLASCAMYYADIRRGTMDFRHKHRDAMMSCAKYVRRLVRCMISYIMHYLDKCSPDVDRFFFEFAARLLLIAYDDLQHQTNGFFTRLLNSPFSTGITSDVRSHWAEHLGLSGTEKEMHQWSHSNPSVQIQRAALSFGAGMETKIKQKSKSYDKNLLVRETLHVSSSRLTRIIEQFHKQADYYPGLFVAIGSQSALSVPPQKVPRRIENHKAMCIEAATCTIKHKHAAVSQNNDDVPTIPDPDKDALPNKVKEGYEHFALSDGRITPCRALITESKDPDPFTKREELIFWKRYKAVVKVPFVEGETMDSSKAWWEQWAKVAEVLPGRGIMDCIAYYERTRSSSSANE